MSQKECSLQKTLHFRSNKDSNYYLDPCMTCCAAIPMLYYIPKITIVQSDKELVTFLKTLFEKQNKTEKTFSPRPRALVRV